MRTACARPSSSEPRYILPAETEDLVEQVALSDRPVFLYGETGTGKTILARLIHQMSGRATRPFERFDVATCPPALLATQLFGCERGAFTDAKDSRCGLVEIANTGTLFIDEIDGLGYEEQRMLLTLCHDGAFRRVGSTAERKVNVRIIAASNVPPRVLLSTGRLREDLYYRISVFSHHLPPLRQRQEQFAELSNAVLSMVWARVARHAARAPVLDEQTRAVLRTYHWPGNIRELENVFERAVSLWMASRSDECGRFGAYLRDALHAPAHAVGPSSAASVAAASRRACYRRPPDAAAERSRITAALQATGGRLQEAAHELLGMSRQTLWRKIRRHGIEPMDWRNGTAE
jgi:DNA-binding NtrC family response regulator